MAAPYPQDLRDRVLAAVADGSAARAAADRFGISLGTALRWAGRWRRTRGSAALPMGGDRRSRLAAHRERVRTLVARRPDLTLEEIRAEPRSGGGVAAGLGTVWRFLRKQAGPALEKKARAPPSRRGLTRPRAARRAWMRRRPALDPGRLVFLDETWAATDMARRRGRCARGLRLVAAVPRGHRKTTTCVAGPRATGIAAPLVVDGALNGTTFRAYVEQRLAPTLGPGDTVVMDDLGGHEVAGVREAIAARGARLLSLPPDSPDLDPSEQAFAKLKALLRQAGERTREGLWQAIGRSVDLYRPQECRNLFRNAGYAT